MGDHRRSNRSIESMQVNVNRLKAYREKLVLLSRTAGKTKKGGKGGIDDSTEKVENVSQVNLDTVMPVIQDTKRIAGMTITKDLLGFQAHRQVRQEWSNMKNFGKREVARQKLVAANEQD